MRIVATLIVMTLMAAQAAPGVARSTRAERGEARLAAVLDGRIEGRAVDCLNLHDIRSSEIIDGTAILYRTSGGRVYVNRPDGGGSSLDSNDILVTNTHSSQLCSIDVVRLLDRTSYFPSGFVSLGKFVPYAKAPGGR